MSSASFPPPYSIRISTRAKHVGLRIRPHTGLEVVLPTDFDPRQLPEILHSKRRWIEKHLRPKQPLLQSTKLPEQIFLPAVGEHWDIRYKQISEPRYSIRYHSPRTLSLEGPDRNFEHIAPLLKKWLIWVGKKHLPSWLLRVQKARHLPSISRIQIRAQKTRWASCSCKGTISLNAKLLFLDPETVEYIFIHELCHRLHMNHSTRFWREVARHVPDFPNHEIKLKKTWENMPTWGQS